MSRAAGAGRVVSAAILGGLLLLTLLLVLLPGSGTAGGRSAFSTEPKGLRAALLTLRELGWDARPWTRAPGELPREDEHLVLVAHTASGAAVDLLTGEPARLELALARGSTHSADRIALDLHLLAGWLDTVRMDLEGYARRAHELPGSGITSPVTRVQAVRLHRPIVPGGRLPPPRAQVLFDSPIDRSTPPSDVLLPALAEPFARVPVPPPDPAIQRVATPLAFDLLEAPRAIELEGTLDGEPVRLALDSTAPVSVVNPAWFGLPPGDVLPIPLG